MWQRPACKADGSEYYEYILVYVDDILCISSDPLKALEALKDPPFEYRLKDVGFLQDI